MALQCTVRQAALQSPAVLRRPQSGGDCGGRRRSALRVDSDIGRNEVKCPYFHAVENTSLVTDHRELSEYYLKVESELRES